MSVGADAVCVGEASTATVGGAVFVSGSKPTEVKELVVVVMNVTMAELEAASTALRLLVLSVSVEANRRSRWRWPS